MNSTIEKFGYPETLLEGYEHWVVLLRQRQTTLGAMVLVCKEEAKSFADISPAAFAELKMVLKELETTVRDVLACQKFNYLMLMMVDPHVHFHVLPRYEKTRMFDGIDFQDVSWPKAPDMQFTNEVPSKTCTALRDQLRSKWQK